MGVVSQAGRESLLFCIRADTVRQLGRFSWPGLVKSFALRRCFRPVLTMRLCQAASRSGVPGRLVLPLLQVLHRLATHGAGMDLPWKTRVGAGFCITHGWAMVVSEGAALGANVTLFHGVTLGRRDRIGDDGARLTDYPVIGDEVWIGPHAIIVGGVTIGRGSRIAGGAFVTQDVAPFSIVGGNPAVLLKSGCAPDVMNPAAL